MIELFGKEKRVMEPLCSEREDEVTLYACVEDHMGRVWVDNGDNPACSVVLAADFYFILGKYKESEEDSIIHIISEHRVYAIVLDAQEWSPFLERLQREFPESYRSFTRYAIKGRREWFNKESLERFVKAVEPKFRTERIDERIFHIALSGSWTRDLCSNYKSLEEFQKHGIGYVIMDGNEIISGASSYGYYQDRVEVTIETKQEYRRKGLGLACASAMILECLERDIYPRWDAANRISVTVAEKLGYRFSHEYTVYHI